MKIKQSIAPFIHTQKQKQLLMRVTLMMRFDIIVVYIISNIQKSLGKGSGWIIDSVIDHTISISKCNPLVARSYIKLPKELDHPRKEFIN